MGTAGLSLQLRPLATFHRRQQISLGGEAWLRLGKDLLTNVSAHSGYSILTRGFALVFSVPWFGLAETGQTAGLRILSDSHLKGKLPIQRNDQ